MATDIKRVAKEVLGESKGTGPPFKENWWWSEEVQKIVKTKRECYKVWQKTRNSETFNQYKKVNKEVKKVVSEAKHRAYDDFYSKLGTKDGEKNIYKLAKLRERKTRDFSHIKCIKSEDSRVLVT